jgi:hypothetical protein
MKKYIYLLSAISAALIIGCGESGSVSDQEFSYDTTSIFGFSKEITYKDYLVKAVDDPIIHATVKATNCEAFEEVGNGEYLLKKCIAKPLYIEIKDGVIKDKNVTQDFPILLNVGKTKKDDNFIVTPLTTILATATDKEINKLADKLGVKKEDLFSDTNDKVKKLLPKINAVAIAAASGGAVTNKVKFLQVLKDEVIDKTDSNGDLDVKKTLKDIKEKSISSPHLFGLVMIDDSNISNDDPLESLAKVQNSKVVRLYGLVFDKGFEANISIKDLDDNTSFSDINATSDDSGAWSLSIDENSDLYKTIMNKNHILQFTAVKDDNESIKLTSTISTYKLRSLIKNTKLISASKEKNLIISNVTTAEDAILDKRGALNSKHYDGNLSELRVYYQDKVVKAAAIIKNVIDANASINDDVNDTYELVKNSIISYDTPELDINTSVVDYNASLENNITNDTILSSQLNDISNDIIKNSNKEEVDKFKEVAENAGYVFYRLLAYYKDNNQTDENFVREYTKIIVYPSHYETKTCYLYGNVYDTDWNCDKPKIVENNSNFTLGYYQVNEENSTITYSLDFNDSVYVKDLNKRYSYYGVIKSDTDLNSGKVSTEPMILVDSYDVVDAFRRLPDEDKEKFEELKDKVKDKSRTEVNYALNRWVKSFINDVKDYFKEK